MNAVAHKLFVGRECYKVLSATISAKYKSPSNGDVFNTKYITILYLKNNEIAWNEKVNQFIFYLINWDVFYDRLKFWLKIQHCDSCNDDKMYLKIGTWNLIAFWTTVEIYTFLTIKKITF